MVDGLYRDIETEIIALPLHYRQTHAITGDRSTELESGGRMIDAILTNTLLPNISREFLQRFAKDETVTGVKVTVEDGGFAYDFS